MNRVNKNVYIYIALLVILVTSIIICIGIGPVSISFNKSIEVIGNKLGIISTNIEKLEENIIFGLRLPRVLLGAIVGACLSVTGVSMQALVKNKLADPYILGVSSGASAFATLGMIFGIFGFLGTYALSISAFLGALFTIILVYILARVKAQINMTQLLLSGLVISMMMDSLTNIITLSAPNALGIHNASFWMSGSLAGAKWAYLTLPLIVLTISLICLLMQHRAMNILLLGEEYARTSGVNLKRTQKILILLSSLMAGVCIAVSGTIGFVGLMVPHFSRLLVGTNHKRVLPVSAFLGAILVIWVDALARIIIAPEELPVGILTALIGGPIFIILLKRQNRGIGNV